MHPGAKFSRHAFRFGSLFGREHVVQLNFHDVMPSSRVSLLLAQPKPFVSLHQIAGKSRVSIFIHLSQVVLGHGIPLFRGPAIPLERLRPIVARPDAILIHGSQSAHGRRITLFCGLVKPLGGFGVIDVVGVAGRFAMEIKLAQGILRIDLALFGGFLPPLEGGIKILWRAFAVGISIAQAVFSQRIPLGRRLAIPSDRFRIILFDAQAVRITGAESRSGPGRSLGRRTCADIRRPWHSPG